MTEIELLQQIAKSLEIIAAALGVGTGLGVGTLIIVACGFPWRKGA